jgi:TRAP-type C4-dicarboxylate transport system permease small subunit
MQRKTWIFLGSLFLLIVSSNIAIAQCSICTKTASQLGEGPAKALNSAIVYLAFTPFAIMGYIGWRWWKNEKELDQ